MISEQRCFVMPASCRNGCRTRPAYQHVCARLPAARLTYPPAHWPCLRTTLPTLLLICPPAFLRHAMRRPVLIYSTLELMDRDSGVLDKGGQSGNCSQQMLLTRITQS
jgi:hypothetical protein